MKYHLKSKPNVYVEIPNKYQKSIDDLMQQGIKEGRNLLYLFPDMPLFQRDQTFDDCYANLELKPKNSPAWNLSYDQAYLRGLSLMIEDDKETGKKEKKNLLSKINMSLESLENLTFLI